MAEGPAGLRCYAAQTLPSACAIRRQKEQLMYGNEVVSKWAQALSKVCAA